MGGLLAVLAFGGIVLALIESMPAAGLLPRSFRTLLAVDPGFRAQHMLALEVDRAQPPPGQQSTWTDQQRIEYLRQQSAEYQVLGFYFL